MSSCASSRRAIQLITLLFAQFSSSRLAARDRSGDSQPPGAPLSHRVGQVHAPFDPRRRQSQPQPRRCSPACSNGCSRMATRGAPAQDGRDRASHRLRPACRWPGLARNGRAFSATRSASAEAHVVYRSRSWPPGLSCRSPPAKRQRHHRSQARCPSSPARPVSSIWAITTMLIVGASSMRPIAGSSRVSRATRRCDQPRRH